MRFPRRSKALAAAHAAFTLVELIVSMSLMGVVGGVIYALATESLVSFSRNISINKSYTDAHQSLDRIGLAVQCAGETPDLVGPDGKTVDSSGNPIVSPAAGIAFYRYGSTPNYGLPSTGPSLTATTLNVTASAGQPVPKVGDVLLIGGIGFQATVNSVSGTTSPYTLSFKGQNAAGVASTGSALSTYCVPANPTATTAATCLSGLIFNKVAFIAVNQKLRYYPTAMTTDDTAFNTVTSYKIIASLPTNPTSLLTTATGLPVNAAFENAAQGGRPFRLGQGSSVEITLCAEAPEYSGRNATATNASTSGASSVNRGSFNTIGSFGSFTQMQAAFGPRCPGLLR